MHQPYLNTAVSQLNFMSSDELREIFADEDKLDERVDNIVRRKKIFFCNFFS